MATGIDLGATTETAPPQFTVSIDGTVTFNTAGQVAGPYCAQVRISDGLAYSVVDFILNNTVCTIVQAGIIANELYRTVLRFATPPVPTLERCVLLTPLALAVLQPQESVFWEFHPP